ncbi:MAG: hypothetical protein ACLSCR_06145 [Akkermansia sp.]
MLFWGIRSCITAPVEKPMEVAEKLIEAGKEVGLTSSTRDSPPTTAA